MPQKKYSDEFKEGSTINVGVFGFGIYFFV